MSATDIPFGDEWMLDRYVDPDSDPTFDAACGEPDDLAEFISDLLDELSEPTKSVIEMRVFGRMTFTQIADDLELVGGRGQAHVYWTRGLARLRTLLDDTMGVNDA